MSSLPSGQYADYIIIGVITAVAGLLLKPITDKVQTVSGRGAALISLFILAIACYFGVRELLPTEQAELNNHNAGTGGTHSPAPSSAPSSLAVTSKPTPKESFEETFVHENVAPPPKASRKTGQWAVAIAEPGQHYPKLLTAVSSAIAGSGHSIVTIFRPSASRGAAFDALFSADPVLIRRLGEYCDEILVGKVTSSSAEENPSVPGLLNVTLSFDGKIISTSSGDVNNQFQASAIGAGVNAKEARTNAEDRLAANLTTQLRAAAK
jgi:hypothetical protein